MKGYVFLLVLLVGLVWSVSAEQMDPKLAGTWETTDRHCPPCTLTIQANGQLTFDEAGSQIQIAFSSYTHATGVDLVFQQGCMMKLKLSHDTVLVVFYTKPT